MIDLMKIQELLIPLQSLTLENIIQLYNSYPYQLFDKYGYKLNDLTKETLCKL